MVYRSIIKKLKYIVFASFALCCLHEQGLSQNFGAKSLSLASTSLSNNDAFALFNNPGVLHRNEGMTCGIFLNSPYSMHQMLESALAIHRNLSFGTFGFGIQKSGTEFLNVQNLHLAYGSSISNLDYGGSLELRQTSMSEYGNKMNILFDLGAQTEVIEKLKFAMNISNLNQAMIIDELIFSSIRMGVNYENSEKLFFNLEYEKVLQSSHIVKTSFEYFIINQIAIRTGMQSKPLRPHAGLGIKWKRWNYAYAFARHPFLGNTHAISIEYEISQ